MKTKDTACCAVAHAKQYWNQSRVLKALAHPTRLYIVDRLADGELCVCQLTDEIGADISTVSKHLAVLKKAEVVVCRKQGLQMLYSLAIPCLGDFFKCLERLSDHSHSATSLRRQRKCKR